MRKNDALYRMVTTAVLLGIGLVLPFLTGQLPTLGRLISPLHIPVLICGLTCGWAWGGAMGAVLPVLRMALFGMPAAPVAYPMTFELCAYGVLTGLMYPLLRRVLRGQGKAGHLAAILIAMVIAMVCGRLAGGAAKAMLLALGAIKGNPLTLQAFIASYFVDTAVGAAIHLVVVPAVVIALESARLSPVGASLPRKSYK